MRHTVPAFLVLAIGVFATIPAWAQHAAVTPPAPAVSIPRSERIAFRVLREDVDIGSHDLVFTRDGEQLQVDIAIDLKVTFLGVSLYRYSHRARETWLGSRLMTLESSTDDNGKAYKVSGRGSDTGFAVTVEGRETMFPPDALPSSHWNRAWLDGRTLINTQKGEKIAYSVIARGSESVVTANGPIAAEHFAVTGDLQMDIWYDAKGRWVKTRFDAPDGSSIFYVLQ